MEGLGPKALQRKNKTKTTITQTIYSKLCAYLKPLLTISRHLRLCELSLVAGGIGSQKAKPCVGTVAVKVESVFWLAPSFPKGVGSSRHQPFIPCRAAEQSSEHKVPFPFPAKGSLLPQGARCGRRCWGHSAL